MTGHLFIINADISRLKCDAWLLPSDKDWIITSAFSRVVGESEEFQYKEIPEGGWPSNGMILLKDGEGQEPDIWLGDIGRPSDTEPSHYALRAKEFAKVATNRVLEQRGQQLKEDNRLPLIAVNVLGSGKGGKRSQRGELIHALLPALFEITETNVDVILVCYGKVMYSAVQSARRRHLSMAQDSNNPFVMLGDGLCKQAEDIASKAQKGQVVLFLGAGISVESGIPAWQALLNGVANELGMTDREIAGLGKFDPRDQGTILAKKAEGKLDLKIKERMNIEKYALIHALLASLPVTETVTTNFDQLFESACRSSGGSVSVLPGEQVRVGQRWLLKLHGDIGGAIVFTRDEYHGAMATHSALRGIVQAMLMTRHMLFVGYSLRDDDFHQLVHEVRSAYASVEEFGDALVLEESALTGDLWPEINFLNMSLESNSENQNGSTKHQAVRRLWIFLDLIGMLASSELAYLIDESFDDLKSINEVHLSEIVANLKHFVEEAPGAWPELVEFLKRFGQHMS